MSVWMVKDMSQPDLYSEHFDEFGPFPNEAAAREFAQIRPSYWAHACSTSQGGAA